MLIFFIFILLFSTCFSSCPKEAVEWQSVCYFFQPNETAFMNAENNCIQLGGHLASVHDGFTNAFLAQQGGLLLHSSTTSDIWIGATDLILSGNFSWTDNSSFSFTEWGQSKNASGEDCVSMNLSTGRWLAQDCFKLKPYICGVSSAPSNPNAPPFFNCSIGWIYFEPTGACYDFILPSLGFYDAIKYCENHSFATVSVHTKIENEFLRTLQLTGSSRNYWLSLYSVDDNNIWQWSDHTPVDFLNWGPGYPKLDLYQCAYVYTDGFWYNDAPCSNTYQTVCKRPDLNPTKIQKANSKMTNLTKALMPSKILLFNTTTLELESEQRSCLNKYATEIVFPKTDTEVRRSIIFFIIGIPLGYLIFKCFLSRRNVRDIRIEKLDFICFMYYFIVMFLAGIDLIILIKKFKFQKTFDANNYLLSC